jgi:hypothetical protein
MLARMAQKPGEVTADEWASFPGGELEGRRPRTLCPACREALKRTSVGGNAAPRDRGRALTLCFGCYRAELDRQQAIAAAGVLDTASDARFQYQLPFEPLNRPRLDMLKADRASARSAALATPAGALVDRRRQRQIAARHVLQEVAAGLHARRVAKADRDRAMASAFHAAELQLPESWIPFVMSR